MLDKPILTAYVTYIATIFLQTWSLNKYLDSFMEGLTAKVFRTYNASVTLQKLLKKLNECKIGYK